MAWLTSRTVTTNIKYHADTSILDYLWQYILYTQVDEHESFIHSYGERETRKAWYIHKYIAISQSVQELQLWKHEMKHANIPAWKLWQHVPWAWDCSVEFHPCPLEMRTSPLPLVLSPGSLTIYYIPIKYKPST